MGLARNDAEGNAADAEAVIEMVQTHSLRGMPTLQRDLLDIIANGALVNGRIRDAFTELNGFESVFAALAVLDGAFSKGGRGSQGGSHGGSKGGSREFMGSLDDDASSETKNRDITGSRGSRGGRGGRRQQRYQDEQEEQEERQERNFSLLLAALHLLTVVRRHAHRCGERRTCISTCICI